MKCDDVPVGAIEYAQLVSGPAGSGAAAAGPWDFPEISSYAQLLPLSAFSTCAGAAKGDPEPEVTSENAQLLLSDAKGDAIAYAQVLPTDSG